MSKLEPFQYDILDLKSDSIRLVHVDGFDEDGRVKCSLRHTKISEARYYALSYTWGSRADLQTINLNGKALQIRRNLCNFLETVAISRATQKHEGLTEVNSREAETLLDQLEIEEWQHPDPDIRQFWVDPNSGICWGCARSECGCYRRSELPRIGTFYPQDRRRLTSTNGQNVNTTAEVDGFWIDAICLDQQNVSERNHQVQQMHIIYKQALVVFAWLGEASSRSLIGWFLEARWCKGLLGCYLEINYNALLEILKFDYWYRAWIVQEIIAAGEIMLVCDEFVLPWKVRIYTGSRAYETYRLSRMFALDKLRDARNGKLYLENCLNELDISECADARDRIYSVRSLLAGGLGFSVDYEESLLSLALRASIHFGRYRDFTIFQRLLRTFKLPFTSPLLNVTLGQIADSESDGLVLRKRKYLQLSKESYLCWLNKEIGEIHMSVFKPSEIQDSQQTSNDHLTVNLIGWYDVWRCPSCDTSLEDDRWFLQDLTPTDPQRKMAVFCLQRHGNAYHFVPLRETQSWIGPVHGHLDAKTLEEAWAIRD